jgi:hypothetical protein
MKKAGLPPAFFFSGVRPSAGEQQAPKNGSWRLQEFACT